MSKLLFISDCHFGHKNITKYRPQFESPEEHDEVIFDNIMSALGKRVTLWMLGDTCFDTPSMAKVKAISNAVEHLNYIPGNHDTDSTVRLALYKEMVTLGLFHKTGSLFTQKDFWVCHAPIHPAELRGKFNLHGHTHDTLMPEPQYINVCVEHTKYTPICYDELRAIKEARSK